MDIYELIQKGKIKRYLTARNKIIYPEAVYHITQRAPGREILFVEDNDYLYMLSLLKKISKKFNWIVYAFVFMPNHIHILLKISEANLSEGMKNLCERYAKYFNKKYERKGPVFSRPYRAALCLDDMYLVSVSIYIHLNPLKAKLCKKIDDYKWSSLKLYIIDKENSFVNPKLILEILDKSDSKRARETYIRLLKDTSNIGFKNIIEHPNFIDVLKSKIRNILKKLNFSKIGDTVEEDFEKFIEKSQEKEKDILVRKYLIQQLLARGFRIKDIAEKLKVSRKTIYNTLKIEKGDVLKPNKLHKTSDA